MQRSYTAREAVPALSVALATLNEQHVVAMAGPSLPKWHELAERDRALSQKRSNGRGAPGLTP